jgi:hypothetical protein
LRILKYPVFKQGQCFPFSDTIRFDIKDAYVHQDTNSADIGSTWLRASGGLPRAADVRKEGV